MSKKSIERRDLFSMFLVPTLIGKLLLFYFGLMYTAYPGEGYGYALLASIVFTVTMVARFLWKYRDYDGG